MPRASVQRIDWGKQENTERLLAAVLAAQGLKMDYHRVAKMFGYGATYNSIEGQLRKAKRIAASLLDGADKEKSEEVISTDEDEKRVKKETLGNPRVRAKKSGRFPSSLSGEKITPEEPVVGREKKEEQSEEVKVAGKRVVGGRVTKGGAATGRKKGAGVKVEDEVQVLEFVHLDD